MRLHCRKTFRYRIATACVLWTLVLLNLQPSDGSKGKFETIFDIYGERREHLQPGDVFERENLDLLLIYNIQFYFRAFTEYVKPNQRDIELGFYDHPHWREYDWLGKLRKIGAVPNQEVTNALARKLADKWLPYHPKHCHNNDWMKYILYGKTTISLYSECPLAASLEGVTAKQIEDGTFKFRTSYGKEVDDFISTRERRHRILVPVRSQKKSRYGLCALLKTVRKYELIEDPEGTYRIPLWP